jgi:hypothetical protein
MYQVVARGPVSYLKIWADQLTEFAQRLEIDSGQMDVVGNTDLLMTAVKKLRPQITGMLLNQWGFGTEFATVGEECEDWFRNPDDKPDLCDLVLIAQYHALIGTPEMKHLPPVASLPAFAKLGMADLGVEQIIEFLKRSRTEIEAIEVHLGAI